ncbi:hypothetical protein RAS1_13070 [Phycisphaerae bacterium RAS1]|nr:hypothetical protein RAS1_13070 [Phycisphaerae bacterium RAS1]
MMRMSLPPKSTAVRPARRLSVGACLIIATLLVCGAALFFRGPIRARYWAEMIERAPDAAQRARYVTALCNAGDDAAWGIDRLLRSASSESRQLAAIVLQHQKTAAARERLLTLLSDHDDAVRELAALGLAMRGDASIIPRLESMYASADWRSGSAACVALERLGTPGAIAALERLAHLSAEPPARAALIDALDGIRDRACGPALLILLADDRLCATPARSQQRLDRLFASGVTLPGGLALPGDAGPPDSQPSSAPTTHTLSDRAAAALARLTGLDPERATPAQRDAAAAAWRGWIEARRPSSAPGP